MFEFFKRPPKKDQETPISNIATLVREGDNLLSDSLILLDEQLSGNLYCAEEIVVEQNGILSGNMTSKRCIVSGTINGDIVSTDQMDIKSTAVIRGNIKSPAINIEPGAVINGKVIIASDNRAAAKLMERINNHSADEYQTAKLSVDKTDELAPGEAVAFKRPFTPAPKAPEKVVVSQLQDKPVAIKHEEPPLVAPEPPKQQKPLVAPTPQTDNASDAGEATNKWW